MGAERGLRCEEAERVAGIVEELAAEVGRSGTKFRRSEVLAKGARQPGRQDLGAEEVRERRGQPQARAQQEQASAQQETRACATR